MDILLIIACVVVIGIVALIARREDNVREIPWIDIEEHFKEDGTFDWEAFERGNVAIISVKYAILDAHHRLKKLEEKET